MLGGSLRPPAAALAVVALGAVGCADLIGLNDLNGSGGSGGSVGSGGTASGSGGDSLGGSGSCALDDFADRLHTQTCWQIYNGEQLFGSDYTVNEEEGLLITRPNSGPSWADGDSAFFMYQEVTDNFLLEVKFSVFAGSTTHLPEDYPQWHNVTGGILGFPALLALEDNPGPFTDYYAIKAGSLRPFDEEEIYAGFAGEITAEPDGRTSMTEQPDASGWDEVALRMCRYGALIWTGYRREGDTQWSPFHVGDNSNGYDTTKPGLPDLPGVMYVGLVSELEDDAAPDGDARIVFSHAQFSEPKSLDDCQL